MQYFVVRHPAQPEANGVSQELFAKVSVLYDLSSASTPCITHPSKRPLPPSTSCSQLPRLAACPISPGLLHAQLPRLAACPARAFLSVCLLPAEMVFLPDILRFMEPEYYSPQWDLPLAMLITGSHAPHFTEPFFCFPFILKFTCLLLSTILDILCK